MIKDLLKEGWNFCWRLWNITSYMKNGCEICIDKNTGGVVYKDGNEELPKSFKLMDKPIKERNGRKT